MNKSKSKIVMLLLEQSQLTILDLEGIVENQCCKAIKQITKIVKSQEYDDIECFKRIEAIIVELEKIGIDSGFRHDFG